MYERGGPGSCVHACTMKLHAHTCVYRHTTRRTSLHQPRAKLPSMPLSERRPNVHAVCCSTAAAARSHAAKGWSASLLAWNQMQTDNNRGTVQARAHTSVATLAVDWRASAAPTTHACMDGWMDGAGRVHTAPRTHTGRVGMHVRDNSVCRCPFWGGGGGRTSPTLAHLPQEEQPCVPVGR